MLCSAGSAKQAGLYARRHRRRGHAVLLLWPHPSVAGRQCAALQRRHSRLLQHHSHPSALQADTPLEGAEDSGAHFQGERQGAFSSRFLSRAGHRHLCQSRLLRWAVAGKSAQWLQVDSRGVVVSVGTWFSLKSSKFSNKLLFFFSPPGGPSSPWPQLDMVSDTVLAITKFGVQVGKTKTKTV